MSALISYLSINKAWFGETGYILPNWAWVAIAAVVLTLIVLIIVFAVKGNGKKKKAEEAARKNAQSQEPVRETPLTEVSEEEYAEREPVRLTPVKRERAKEQEEVREEESANKPDEPGVVKHSAKPAPKSGVKKTAATPAEKSVEKKTTAKPVSKPAGKSAVKPKPVQKDKEEDKVYHISRRKDENKWQIKAEGGAKAVKLFNTQAEAIEYAKQLAENQDARIMIHKADGSFRRLDYKN